MVALVAKATAATALVVVVICVAGVCPQKFLTIALERKRLRDSYFLSLRSGSACR